MGCAARAARRPTERVDCEQYRYGPTLVFLAFGAHIGLWSINQNVMYPDFPDVDALMKAAREDPAALELLRKSMIERLIESAPNEAAQRRLRGLQFRVDVERERAPNPMAACIILSRMMHESLAELREALQAPDTRSLPNEPRDHVDNVILMASYR